MPTSVTQPWKCVCNALVSVPHSWGPAHLVCTQCMLTFGIWAFSCSGVRCIWTRSMGVCRHCTHLCTMTCACVSVYARGSWGGQPGLRGSQVAVGTAFAIGSCGMEGFWPVTRDSTCFPSAQCQATAGQTSALSTNSTLYKAAFPLTCSSNGKEAAIRMDESSLLSP